MKTTKQIMDEYINVILVFTFIFTLAEALILTGLRINAFITAGISILSFFVWYLFISLTTIWVKR